MPTLIEHIFLNHHHNESNGDPSKSIESDEPVRLRTKASHLKTPNTLLTLYHVPIIKASALAVIDSFSVNALV